MKQKLRVYPQTTPLSGRITVPGDKSVSHRSVMLGSLANGVSHVRRWLPAGDPKATLEIFRQMGVQIDVVEHSPTDWELTIHGVGMRGLTPSDQPLDSMNAGTCMRLLAGVMAGQSFSSVLDGSPQLRKRPMKRIIVPLEQMGAKIESQDGKAPMTIHPTTLKAITYDMPVASGQVKSCVLLAGMYANGETAVIEPGPARDHTERMLKAMGADVRSDGAKISIRPVESLNPLDMTVPADISSAAFPLIAAAIVPGSEIVIENCGMNETRTGILDMVKAIGVNVEVSNEAETGGEPTADLTIRHTETHGATIGGGVVVRGIDEFPALTVALSQATGRSEVRDAAELRVKEVDRISVLAGELKKMGLNTLEERPDGYVLDGPVRLHGAEVESHDDHRLGMALSVAALVADSPTIINEANCMADSFPGFVETMQALGARMEWL